MAAMLRPRVVITPFAKRTGRTAERRLSVMRTYSLDEARDIAEKLEVDFDKTGFDLVQFRDALDAEAEHGQPESQPDIATDDPLSLGRMSLVHLSEGPDYYTRQQQESETVIDPIAVPDVAEPGAAEVPTPSVPEAEVSAEDRRRWLVPPAVVMFLLIVAMVVMPRRGQIGTAFGKTISSLRGSPRPRLLRLPR
jgi:hypothetical protein